MDRLATTFEEYLIIVYRLVLLCALLLSSQVRSLVRLFRLNLLGRLFDDGSFLLHFLLVLVALYEVLDFSA